MRQHLDAGGVQVEVTHIAQGSVVVEFHLLIISDVGVQEVSAAFLAAFQNASPLEVVGGDTFIWGTRGRAPAPRRRVEPEGLPAAFLGGRAHATCLLPR